MSDIEFRDPIIKGPRAKAGLWRRRLSPLVDHPGRWAVVHRTDTAQEAYNAATALRAGRVKALPGAWSFTACKTSDGGEVFARYDGPEEEA